MLRDRLKASQATKQLGINVHVRTVQRILQNHAYTEYARMKPAPFLIFVHSEKRLLWAKETVVKDAAYWRNVTFTDEKRWFLDEPVG